MGVGRLLEHFNITTILCIRFLFINRTCIHIALRVSTNTLFGFVLLTALIVANANAADENGDQNE